jgi:hypothetical protein
MSSSDLPPDSPLNPAPPDKRADKRETGATNEINLPQAAHFSALTLVSLLVLLLAIGCGGGIGFAWLIIHWNIGIAGQLLYYILLLVWGLICAIILFVGLHSYAHVVGNHLGWRIELGGPSALFAAVVIGGSLFVPKQPDLNFTVWVRLPDRGYANAGTLTMNINQSQPIFARIETNGQAMFGNIPTSRLPEIQDGSVEFTPHVPGFPEMPKPAVYLTDKQRYEFTLDSYSTDIRGKILRLHGQNGAAEIHIEHLATLAVGPENGFRGAVQAKSGSIHLVEVCIHGMQARLESLPIGTDMTIQLRELKGPCRVDTGN